MDDLRSLLLVDLVTEELLCEYFHTHFGLVILTLLFLLVILRSIPFILKLINLSHVDTCAYTGWTVTTLSVWSIGTLLSGYLTCTYHASNSIALRKFIRLQIDFSSWSRVVKLLRIRVNHICIEPECMFDIRPTETHQRIWISFRIECRPSDWWNIVLLNLGRNRR